jgi:cold-inducible RNA-binding protein
MSARLYVGNLSYDTTEDTLRELFGADGRQVEDAAVITDRETGRSRGFGFVTMSTPEEAQAAMDELDGRDVDGRNIRVNEAREREQRSGGGGGGGRGGGGDRW